MFKSTKRLVVVALVLLLPGMVAQTLAGQAQAANQMVETNLTDFVPSWVKEGGRSEMLKRMVDPQLRQQIEEEINGIVNERVKSTSDIIFPVLGNTLEDWMLSFDRETGVDYELQAGIGMFSLVNLDYNNGNTLYVDEFAVYDLDKKAIAFTCDFAGKDGDDWDSGLFSQIWGSGSGADVTFSIENNTGKMDIGPRREGSGSAYSRVTPIMKDLDNSEVLMRFRVDEVGLNQYIRVWVQSDKFSSGSSFAANGYGIALHFGRDELTLQNRTASTTVAIDKITANMTTDWHWLRLRAAHGKVLVKLWSDNDKEPADWAIEYDIPRIKKKAMLSFANLDRENENTFYIDELKVQSPSGNDLVFQYEFKGTDGDDWDSDAFDLLYSRGVTYSIQQNTGKIELAERQDSLNASYGKLVPLMGNTVDSDLLMRFRVDKVGDDQWIKVFVRADEFQEGNSSPLNGYGIQLDLKTKQLTIFRMENKNTYYLTSTNVDLTTDWHWLKLRAAQDQIAVKLWKAGEEELEDWILMHEISENISAGESIMRLLMLRVDPETIYYSK